MSKHNRSTNFKTLQIFWRFTREYKLRFWLGTSGAVLGTIVQDIIPPLIVARGFNLLQDQVNSNSPLELSQFWPFIIAYAICMLLGLIIWRLQVIAVWMYEVPVIENLALHIFNHLQKMGAGFHANRFGGALVSQTTKFLSAYEKIMDEFTWSVVTGITAISASMIVLTAVAPLYAAVYGAISILYFLIVYRLQKRSMPLDRALAASESDRTAKFADMITNVSAVNSYAGEEHEFKRFNEQTKETSQAYYRLLRRVLKNDIVGQGITNSLGWIAFVSGILAITVFNSPAGVLFLAVSYTMSLTRRLWESSRTMRNFSRAFGDSTDMTEILQLEPEIQDPVDSSSLDVSDGSIEFKAVGFAYQDSDSANAKVFHDLSLKIEGGEKIGLVGHSGGGKTTITKLLLRFMDIQEGQILVDGQDITKVTQSDLRRAIAYVPQEPMLFHRSIAENIAYGKPGASIKEIEAVAKKAHAHEFIKDLPHGYQTLVGERGVKLSGGQRQRVAIARAMLKDAPILVLDEATSALDSESEKYIQDALWELMKGRTAIVIAHRLSTVQKMDRILVLEDGAVVQDGPHAELVKSKGIYSDLWNHQSGGFLEE